jgi:hypothetical protein
MTRQRFDIDISGSGFPVDLYGPITVLIPGDRSLTTLCVPDGSKLGVESGGPVCCEGGSTRCGEAGDTAANIVYGQLNFLLEFPESGLNSPAAGPKTRVIRASDRQLAGMQGNCYLFEPESAEAPAGETPEVCFGDDGVELYRTGYTPFGRAKLTATTVSFDVDDGDFEYPYPLISAE